MLKRTPSFVPPTVEGDEQELDIDDRTEDDEDDNASSALFPPRSTAPPRAAPQLQRSLQVSGRHRTRSPSDQGASKQDRSQILSHEANSLRLSTSAPEVYAPEDNHTHNSEEITSPTDSEDTSFNDTTTEEPQIGSAPVLNQPPRHPNLKVPAGPISSPALPLKKTKKDSLSGASVSHLRNSSPIKLSRNLKKKASQNLLKRSTTDLRLKEKRRRVNSGDATPVVDALFAHFLKSITEQKSAFIRVVLRHARGNEHSERTQLSLLSAVANLILVPNEFVLTPTEDFLKAFMDDDFQPFTAKEEEEYWAAFGGKNVDALDVFDGVSDSIELIEWYHVVEVFIASLLSKSGFFRDAFRSFVEKLESSSVPNDKGARARKSRIKRHKIFPLFYSFLTDLISDQEQIPIIFIETLSTVKKLISARTGKWVTGVLFRMVAEAIAALLSNPRKWSFEQEFPPPLRSLMREAATILIASLLNPDYKCDNPLEKSLLDNICTVLESFIEFCTNPFHTVPNPRVMAWEETKPSVAILYHHVILHFESLWAQIVTHTPEITFHLLSFAVVSFEAIQENNRLTPPSQ